MPVGLSAAAFGVATAVSLASSYLLVTRLERIGWRLGLSEALLGVVAALAANAPEVTSSVTALASHQDKISAGVIVGSNVFNLAALLGLGGAVAGRIALHRRVVALNGAVGTWVAVVCLVTVLGLIGPGVGLLLVAALLVPYLIVLGAGQDRLARLPGARHWGPWLRTTLHEEEVELAAAIHPRRGRLADAAAAAAALVVVVAASVTMEQSAVRLGTHFGIAGIVTGGIVLAAVTSLPNAVAAVYLAARGRGAAMLSTTLNSNALNVTAGLLAPALFTGLGPPSAHSDLIVAWYLVLTLAALALAWRHGGVSRASGLFVIGSYLVFTGSLLATASAAAPSPWLTVLPVGVVAGACLLGLVRAGLSARLAAVPRRAPGPPRRPGWRRQTARPRAAAGPARSTRTPGRAGIRRRARPATRAGLRPRARWRATRPRR